MTLNEFIEKLNAIKEAHPQAGELPIVGQYRDIVFNLHNPTIGNVSELGEFTPEEMIKGEGYDYPLNAISIS